MASDSLESLYARYEAVRARNEKRASLKSQHQLIKNAALAIQKKDPRTKEHPIYYLPNEYGDPEAIAAAVSQMHDLRELPVPSRCGLVAMECGEGVVLYRFGESHSGTDTTAMAINVSNAWGVSQTAVVLWGRQRWDKTPRAAYVQNLLSDGVPADIAAFLDRCLPEKDQDVWCATEPMPPQKVQENKDYAATSTRASVYLSFLANIAVPCGYEKYTTMLPNATHIGHGQHAPRELITIIHHNRMYAEAHDGATERRSPMHHLVRGHVRFLWKAAGIDRQELPRQPALRQRIARNHDVEAVSIPPHWRGSNEVTMGGLTYRPLQKDHEKEDTAHG